MTSQPTVWDVTYELLRELCLTTVFGNPDLPNCASPWNLRVATHLPTASRRPAAS